MAHLSRRPSRSGVDRNVSQCSIGWGNSVAPPAGAWIETLKRKPKLSRRNGRPSRRGVDRNPRRAACVRRFLAVAPHAGAWIETYAYQWKSAGVNVAPHAGAWIETPPRAARRAMREGRPSRRGVDRSPNELLGFDGRPSRRGVDRNEAKAMKPGMEDKSPLTQGRGSKRQPDVRNDLRPTNSTSQHGLQARPSDRSGNSDTRRRISSHKNFGIMHLTSYARLASS
jgi:hypothetical protein